MENALQVLCLGGLGGAVIYVIAKGLEKGYKGGEKDRSASGDGGNPAARSGSIGYGFQTEVLARIETLERAFQEQNEEVTARFNRLAARSRRREPAGEPGPENETAEGLTRKQELRAKVAAARQRSLPISLQQILKEGRS